MDQAAVLNGLRFDLLSFCQDCRPAPEVDIGGGQIAETLVVAVVVVVLDEGGDGSFELALQEIVFQQNAVLQRLVPALDLALRLRVVGRTANVIHAMFAEVFGQVIRNVTRAVVAQKPGLVAHRDAVAARCC